MMNADRLAKWYRWVEYAVFGRTLERSRFVFLERLSEAQRILVLGEGDGRALARLLGVATQAQLDVVELSARMIELARARIGGSNRVSFRQENALAVRWPSGAYDGVVTLYFLDCFNDADARVLVGRIAEAMAPGGIWLISEFGVPEQRWRRWHAKLWLWVMYRFFGISTGLRTRQLPPVETLLREAGLRKLERREARWGLIRSEVWMKESGVRSL